MKMIRLVLLILLLQFIGLSILQAADGWEVNLIVSVGGAENRLSFGQRPDATDGVDGQYDVPAMLSGDVMAYFSGSGGNLWRDIKALTPGETKVWDIEVESPLRGQMVMLKWKKGLLPGDVRVNLIDDSAGVVIDMKAKESYSYQNNGIRQFKVEVSQ